MGSRFLDNAFNILTPVGVYFSVRDHDFAIAAALAIYAIMVKLCDIERNIKSRD